MKKQHVCNNGKLLKYKRLMNLWIIKSALQIVLFKDCELRGLNCREVIHK